MLVIQSLKKIQTSVQERLHAILMDLKRIKRISVRIVL